MTRFCIILGAMKAGTTSLFNYLAQHPEIAPCSEKEPNFFSHHYEKGIDWYLSLWKDQELVNKVLLEASTNYTKHPSFPKSSDAIMDFSRNHDVSLKFIYIMRDPFERLESQYTYSFTHWTSESLEERIKHGHIINVSQYAHQLDRYYENFNPDRFLLLDFDDLKRKPAELLKQICNFLGINTDFQFQGLQEIHNKSTDAVITRPINKIYKDHPLIKSFADIFPKNFRRSLSRLLFRTKIATNFKLTQKQRDQVYDALKNDMARLHEKYGVDVRKWGF